MLIRLDDACSWHDRARWQRVEDLLDRHGVRPLVAVIPDCQDPDLQVFAEDADFWSRARAWQQKGWELALHGCTHRFETRNAGLVPLNRYSEFAGVSEQVQRAKILSGMAILQKNGLQVYAWVAPAHSFDRTTLKILYEETAIRLVSDGLSQRAFRRFGFVWVPQQLWRPRSLKRGLWTLCLHPNEMTDHDFVALDEFLASRSAVTSAEWADWVALSRAESPVPKRQKPPTGSGPRSSAVPSLARWGVPDALFGAAFLAVRWAKRVLTRTRKLVQRAKGRS